MVQRVEGLNCISQPFSEEEVDNVIKHMKVDRAPGPDGFNGMFVKKCWRIIRKDFLQLCQDFYSGRTPLHSINASYITLVPKKNSPETVNDF
jgi:hypothetical protein